MNPVPFEKMISETTENEVTDDVEELITDLLKMTQKILKTLHNLIKSNNMTSTHFNDETIFRVTTINDQTYITFQKNDENQRNTTKFNSLINFYGILKKEIKLIKQLPHDLDEAWKKGQISLNHVGKEYTKHTLHMNIFKNNDDKLWSNGISCEIPMTIHNKNGKNEINMSQSYKFSFEKTLSV
tara:strand:- start:996 stop:1547 length:552 start_codon:yes stop_codon:yes gene_type:complete